MRQIFLSILAAMSTYCAAVTPAESANERIQNYYQASAKTTPCDVSGACEVTFVTTARTLIQRASCILGLPDGGVLNPITVTATGTDAQAHLQFFSYPELDGQTPYATNSDVGMVVEKGQTIFVSTGAYYAQMQYLQCSLFGYTM